MIILRKIFAAIFFVFLGLLVLQTLRYHGSLVTYPGATELREVAMIYSTKIVTEGASLYSPENQPLAFNAYGPYYHNLVSFVLPLFENTWVAHRAVTGFCLLMILVIYAFLWRRFLKLDWAIVCLLVLSLYHSLMFHVTPLARPDTLGLLIFTVCLCIPVVFGFGLAPLFIAALIGTAAFFTKIYFFLAPVILVSYVFFFVSRLRGLLVGIAVVLSLLLQLYVIELRGPYILNNLFNIYTNTTTMYRAGMGYALSQAVDFMKFNFGYVIVLAGAFVVTKFLRFCSWRNLLVAVKKFRLEKLPDRLSLGLLLWAFVVCVFIFFYKLGPHGGTYMTYAFHLIQPFFLSLVALAVAILVRRQKRYLPVVLVLGILTAYNSYQFSLPEKKFERDEKTAEIVGHFVKDGIALGSPAVAGVFYDLGMPLQDTGMTEFFEFSAPKKTRFNLGVDGEEVRMKWNRYLDEIRDSIRTKKYSALFLVKGTLFERLQSDYLSYYRKVDTFNISFPHTGQNWPVEVYLPQ